MNRDIFEEFVLRKGYKMGENWAYGMMAEYPVAICSDDHSITVIFRIDPMDARTCLLYTSKSFTLWNR